MTTPIIANDGATGQAEVVLGVDTHKDIHVAAVCTALGAVLATESFPATMAGYRQLLAWASAAGPVRRAGVEGTGSYGAALARFLRRADVQVIEINRPDRAARRHRGKSDTVDAQAAAFAVISGRAAGQPKSGDGQVEQIRVCKIAKDSAVKARRQAVNQLKAILVSGDPQLREQLSGLGKAALITRCAVLHDQAAAPDTVTWTLSLLARRIKNLDAEIRDLLNRITELVRAAAPALLDEHGVGADSAAVLLVAAGDNPGRLHGEAAFAALCGVSPVEMSSGKTTRRRLNRGGNRQANAALHRVAIVRLRDQPATRAYLERRTAGDLVSGMILSRGPPERRTAEGHTKREVIRCLKRYIARQLFRIIRAAFAPTAPALAA